MNINENFKHRNLNFHIQKRKMREREFLGGGINAMIHSWFHVVMIRELLYYYFSAMLKLSLSHSLTELFRQIGSGLLVSPSIKRLFK